MIKLIAAMDSTGLLGFNNTIPWSYPVDMKRFKALTMEGILIMGQNTVKSLPRTLPGRIVIAISDEDIQFATYKASSFLAAVDMALNLSAIRSRDIWIAGGASVYNQALDLLRIEQIDITYIPTFEYDKNAVSNVVHFPIDKLNRYEIKNTIINEQDNRLRHITYGLL